MVVVSDQLPRLRLGLDFMPSPDPEHPGLLIRDPFKFSDAMLLIPPQLVACLACFDGEQTVLDLRASLVRLTGEIQIGELEKHLFDTLSQSGFLEDEKFEAMRSARVSEFTAAPTSRGRPFRLGLSGHRRGSPARRWTNSCKARSPRARRIRIIAIAAPHVSPFGGWESYRDAYAHASGVAR